MELNREQALSLLKKYNQEPFHIQHALTVEGVMRWFAQENGEDPEFWGLVGLLHDIDFEVYPDEHCLKAPEHIFRHRQFPRSGICFCGFDNVLHF